MSARLNRRQLLRRGTVGGGVVLSGSVFGALAGRADAATPSDNDLAYLRLLLAGELLEADFQVKALATRKLTSRARSTFRKMAADEKAHYTQLAQLVTTAGQTPATAGDIDFSYPRGSFASQSAILRMGAEIEKLVLGSYLGAVENVESAELRLPMGRISANEAQHVGSLAALRGGSVIGRAFAASLQIDAASAALDRFES